jgi:predicted GIY-YIG superfamily endonuclease
MDTDSKNMVEVYDNATGQHYFRECTAEELSFYEDLAREQEALKLEQPIIEA